MDQQAQPAPAQAAPAAPAQPAAPAAPAPEATSAPVTTPATPAQPAAPAAPAPEATSAPATTPAAPMPASTPSANSGQGAANAGQVKPAKKSVNTVLLAVLAVAILAGGGFVAYQMSTGKAMYQGATMTKESSPVVSKAPSPTAGAVKSGDAQIDQQSDAIDSSMDKLNSDVSNVDKGLQDQADSLN